jgi:hypothetical protein
MDGRTSNLGTTFLKCQIKGFLRYMYIESNYCRRQLLREDYSHFINFLEVVSDKG